MTFYSVSIYSSKLAGQMTGLDSAALAMELIRSGFAEGLSRNAPWCEQCRLSRYSPSSESELYHTFLVQLPILRSMIENQQVTWTKKRGMGRMEPAMFLCKPTDAFINEEFVIDVSEV